MIKHLLALAGALALSSAVVAQTHPTLPRGEFIEKPFDSGRIAVQAPLGRPAFSTVVHTDGAHWTRLYFSEITLAGRSVIRFTSELDGEMQELDARGVLMWNRTSAYFNGDRIRVEVFAEPGAGDNRIVLDRVAVEFADPPMPVGACGYCGADDRVPSDVDWSGRVMPVGCSAAVYSTAGCAVSAGHCVGSDDVLQFRVPNSLPNCNLQHPPVADQFPITNRLFQNGGVGADWAVMTTGTNNLGQTHFQRYGVFMPIASSPASNGAPAEVWGFGASGNCIVNQRQQYSNGSITSVLSNHYRFNVDITFGNSGSGLISNGAIIGVVTHCPCPNYATRVDLPAFANARAQLCVDVPPPANNTCANAIFAADGSQPFSNIGATTTGPNEPGLCNFAGDANIQSDVWFSYIASCTGTLTVSLCDGNQPGPDKGCAGFCGGQSPDGCWCDDQCDGFGDCCPGVCNDCPSLPFCAAGACDGSCGGQSPEGCWCDDQCAGFGDCCPGVCDDCPALPFCTGGCFGFCGGQSSEGCWCDDQCDGFGDCCTNVCIACPQLPFCGQGLKGGRGGGAGGAGGGGFDTKLGLYSGSCPAQSGTIIACNKDACGLLSEVSIQVTQGQAIRIRIGGHNGAQGSGVLTISCEPDEDDCPADFNNSGAVDVQDLLILLAAWGPCAPGDCDADLNNSGAVDVQDLLILLGAWGPCP